MGVLRQLEESRGHLVHDGDLRQPCEDERLLVPHPQAGEAAPMSEYAVDFGDFDGRIWLNAAHQGPLPRVAVAAAEIIVLADEFPATVFPWLVTEREAVRVRRLELSTPVLPPERLEQELTARTRVVAVNWVRSLTGHVVDLAGLAEVCRRRDVELVVNVTQGFGALPLDVSRLPLAAISCSGFKWLLGPYATGFAWIRPDVLARLRPVQAYWLALPDRAPLDLNRESEHRLRDDLGARAYDVFGTANFLNFAPWAAAVEYLLACGLPAIAAHDQAIVVVSAGERRNDEISRLLAQNKIDVALRAGNLRLSPHLYNTFDDIDEAVGVLIGALALRR